MQKKVIKNLRAMVATRVEELYWAGAEVRGLDVREVVHETNMGIKDYVKNLKKNQWASELEIFIALEISEVSAYVLTPNAKHQAGEETVKNYVVLKKQHWVIAKKVKNQPLASGTAARGGMMDKWTWQDQQKNEELPDALPEWAIPPEAVQPPQHEPAQPEPQGEPEVQSVGQPQVQESSSSSGGEPIVQKSSPSQHCVGLPNETLHESLHDPVPQSCGKLVPPKLVALRREASAQPIAQSEASASSSWLGKQPIKVNVHVLPQASLSPSSSKE